MRLYLLLIILLVLPFALAQEDTTIPTTDISDDTPSYIYLDNNTKIKDLNTFDSALALLALNNMDYDIKSKLNEFIASGKSEGCWPKGGCTVTDTAFGLLVLDKTDQDTNKTTTWLGNREIAAPPTTSNSVWYIQVVTSQNGTCTVECDSSKKTITVSKDQGWFDINTLGCGSSSSKSRNYYVDCSNVGDPTMHISLLYYIRHAGYDESFLLQDEQVQQKDITVDNACFPKSPGSSSCDSGATLYATWVLKELDEDVHTIPYLEEHLTEISQSPLKLALLYMITGSKAYAGSLTDKQKPSGSWGDDIFTTSFVAYSVITGSTENIESYTNATNWLRLKRDKKDSSWNHKILDTAITLIALHSSIDSKFISLAMEKEVQVEDICDDGLDNDGDGVKDCDDSDCVNDVSCLCSKAAGAACESNLDCAAGETCDSLSCTCISAGCSIAAGSGCEIDSDCNLGEFCNQLSCECEAGEVTPISEICDNDEDDDNDGDIDCKDSDCEGSEECKTSLLLWTVILVIVLLLGGFFVFYYTSYIKKGKTFGDFKNDINLSLANLFKKKPKKKTFEEHIAARERIQPVMQRPMQQQPLQYQKPKREKVDEELEKSLEEARKLLGK